MSDSTLLANLRNVAAGALTATLRLQGQVPGRTLTALQRLRYQPASGTATRAGNTAYWRHRGHELKFVWSGQQWRLATQFKHDGNWNLVYIDADGGVQRASGYWLRQPGFRGGRLALGAILRP